MTVGEEFEHSELRCDWCKNEIELGARVCSKCGRHQGLIGWFSTAGIVVGVVVAVLGALLSVYSSNQARTERVQAETALAEARVARQEAINAVEVGHKNYITGLRVTHRLGALDAVTTYRAFCKNDTLNTERCHRLYSSVVTMASIVSTSGIPGGVEASVELVDRCFILEIVVGLDIPSELADCTKCKELETLVPDLLTNIQDRFDAECPDDAAEEDEEA